MAVDSIIFDLDGTLWSCIGEACTSLKNVLSKYPDVKKVITYEDMESCMGLQIKDIGKKLFPQLDESMQIKLMEEFCGTEQVYLEEHGGRLYPKLEETLKILSKKYKLFIVSNCHDGYIQCFFKAHKLDKYFIDFECSGVTGLSKGKNNKLIIKRNSLKSPVYVGDTATDAESAKVAEIPFVFARYGFGNAEEYDYVIDSFEEILTLNLSSDS
ncbi:HAD family hydrolase [Clostridium sp. P21]|uniref:HAD family hydrolase n=1 Tax=Clostridium muellerianum TaxID=2716538 RepID=A0A7Y0EHT2_9CLOT|nr:HAD family hydrolase [Clostridium muellerianum]NMM63733.1 HAD family hydrolase [Clostridium muellerianum]